MKKKLLIAIILGLAFGGGIYWYKSKKSGEEQSAIQTAAVSRGTIEALVTAQGKLEPKQYVDVGAEVSGQIQKLHVDFGSKVKSGDLIAEIDPANYEAAVKGDEARIKQLEAQLRQQDANIEQAKQKLVRNQKLFATVAVSKEALEDAQTAVKIANAQGLSLEAQMEEAQSLLEGDQADLERTKIYAPMDGTVVSLSVKEGQTINANQTAPVIGQLAQLDTMTVRAQVAEADITKLTANMPVYFTTLGSQGRKWNGTVRQILPSPETVNDVVLYNVLADVDNADGSLMTGMTTQLFFVLGKAENVLIVPASVLTKREPNADEDEKKAYVVQVQENRKAVDKIIVTGLTDRNQAEVVSGLSEGDQIILPSSAAPAASGGNAGRRGMGGGPRL